MVEQPEGKRAVARCQKPSCESTTNCRPAAAVPTTKSHDPSSTDIVAVLDSRDD